MKEYTLKLPKNLSKNTKEIVEYLLVKHYEDGILSSGVCALLLNIEKYDFQAKIIDKYENK